MSMPKKMTVNCSKCGSPITVTAFQSINTDYAEDIAEQIISGELFDAQCPKCGFVSHLEYDMLYNDMKHRAMIWVIHKESPEYESQVAEVRATSFIPYKTTRIVEDMNALREKVACLECNRDDRIIELCKVFTAYNLLAKRPEFDFRNAFYTTFDGEEYIFLYDNEGEELTCELPDKAYDYLNDLYFNSSYAKNFDDNYAIVDYEWAEQILMPLIDGEAETLDADRETSVEVIGHENEEKSVICNKCGKTLPDDSTFCQYCGSKIDTIEISADETPCVSKEEVVAKILAASVVEGQKAMEANKESQPHNELDADFGLVPQKPIYTVGIDEQEKYLKSLRTISGEPIKWNRRGSISVEGVNGMVDVYDTYLPSGEEYNTIYINMYGAYNSSLVPKGFSYFTPITSVSKRKTESKSKRHKFKINKAFLILALAFVVGFGFIIGGLVSGFSSGWGKVKSNDAQSTTSNSSSPSNSSSDASSTATTSVTISLDKQGGSGGTSSVTVKESSPMPKATQPTKDGYIFDGYYAKTGGLGTKYYDANMKSVEDWYGSSTKTLYAYWIKDPDNINKKGVTITKDNFENYFTIETEAELVGSNEIVITYSIKPKSNAYAQDVDSSKTIYIEIGAEASMISMYFGEPSFDIRENLTLSKSNNYTASGEISFKHYVYSGTVYWFANVAYCSGSIGN